MRYYKRKSKNWEVEEETTFAMQQLINEKLQNTALRTELEDDETATIFAVREKKSTSDGAQRPNYKSS